MDKPTPIIYGIHVPEYKKITIETSEGYRYTADLSSFQKVFCFPKNLKEWKQVSIDTDGLSLIWSSRFEVHVDQILALTIHRDRADFSSQASL